MPERPRLWRLCGRHGGRPTACPACNRHDALAYAKRLEGDGEATAAQVLRLAVRQPSDGGAEEHPRRRLLRQAIQTNPGINFRALGRYTGLPAGSLAHHLRMLKREGVFVEGQLGFRRIFYPAGMPVPKPGEATMAREPALSSLRDWLARQGQCTQRQLLDAMQAQGWPRSTSQHRVGRLVALGLANERRSGRFVIYEAMPSMRPTPWTMAPHASQAAEVA